MCEAASSVRREPDTLFVRHHLGISASAGTAAAESGPDDELTTTSSIFEFLQQERRCDGGGATGEEDSELDIDSIFEEINRLSGDTRGRCVEDILREAEALISKQELGQLEVPLLAARKANKKATAAAAAAASQPSRLPMRKRPTEVSSGLLELCAEGKCVEGDGAMGNDDGVQLGDDEQGFSTHFEIAKVSLKTFFSRILKFDIYYSFFMYCVSRFIYIYIYYLSLNCLCNANHNLNGIGRRHLNVVGGQYKSIASCVAQFH